MDGLPKRLSTREWLFLIVCLVLVLAFLPGGPLGLAVARVQSTLYGLIPLALLGGAAYGFYRWWRGEESGTSDFTSSRARVCSNCNGEVAANWRMCPNCEHDLSLQRVFCRFCTYPMRSDWRVCPACTRAASEAAPPGMAVL
jgi:hypothetical protein